jgi:predicted CoA-binding protein
MIASDESREHQRSEMKDIARLLEEETTTVAVVGATDDDSKFGYVIYRDLKKKGFTVYPINLERLTVDGDKAYPSLDALPVEPTIVNIVIPPAPTMKVVKKCLGLGLKNVWLQPGSESPEILDFMQEHEFNYLANACIMVESRTKA